MAVLNPSFESGVGVPDNWTLQTNMAETYATFTAWGAGHEGFQWGWPGETHYGDWTDITPDTAIFDVPVAAHPYETWWFPRYYEEWGELLSELAVFDLGANAFEDWETTLVEDWAAVVSDAALFDAGANAFEDFELAIIADWTAVVPDVAQFDNKWGGGGAPFGYEDFEL